MSTLFWIGLVIIAGMFIPVQAGLNAMVKTATSNGILAGCWNTILATLVFLFCLTVTRVSLPTVTVLSTIPWWGYLGGIFGALYVFTSLAAASKLGAILLIAALTAGQLLGSVILDHFGLIGYPLKPINLSRFFGILLLIIGIYFIQK